MAELATDYVTLARHILRSFTGGEVYATGTVAIASGVVTLTSGTFPSWSAQGTLNYQGTLYTVNTRDGDTQVTLDDTSVTVSSGAAYCLIQSPKEFIARVVDDSIKKGLSDFYTPIPAIEGEQPHIWSFLMPTATLTLAQDDYDIDLPADFSHILGEFTYQDGEGKRKLTRVHESTIRAKRGNSSAAGPPQMVAVDEKTFVATTGQRWQALFWPTPDAAYSLEYTYLVEPNHLDPTNLYPYGGGAHASTILSACMAALEILTDDQPGPYAADFSQRLAASVQLDLKTRDVSPLSYSYVEPELGSYDWLMQEVGTSPMLNAGGDPLLWDEVTRRKVRSIVKRGLNKFYMPTGAQLGSSHQWSFLRVLRKITTSATYSTGTVTVASGVVTFASAGTLPEWTLNGKFTVGGQTYDIATVDTPSQITLTDTTATAVAGTTYTLSRPIYELPSDFAGIDGPITFLPGSGFWNEKIVIGAEYDIRRERSLWDIFSTPTHAAIRPKNIDQARTTRFEIQFYPTPDQAYELEYIMRVRWDNIVEGEFPPGGTEHAETMLAACLSVAEGGMGPSSEYFMQLLASSLDLDMSEHSPDSLGENRDRSDDRYYQGRRAMNHSPVVYDDTSL